MTTETATNYRLRSSLNTGGTALVEGAFDFVELVNPISTGTAFPYGTQAVQVVGKFGWTAPPNAIKRLVAILVFDEVKPQNSVLHRVEQQRTETTNYTFVLPDEDAPTGITKADEIIRRYRRHALMVA